MVLESPSVVSYSIGLIWIAVTVIAPVGYISQNQTREEEEDEEMTQHQRGRLQRQRAIGTIVC